MKFLTALAALLFVTCAGAQVFPSKPIRLLVGYPPGGSGLRIE